jgi:hypothetical protein
VVQWGRISGIEVAEPARRRHFELDRRLSYRQEGCARRRKGCTGE